MKKIFLLFAFIGFVLSAFGQTEKKEFSILETSEYIDKIMRDTEKSSVYWTRGDVYNIETATYNNSSNYIYYSFKIEDNLDFYRYSFDINKFKNIDWSKAIKVDTNDNMTPNSPVKFLTIVFPANSILYESLTEKGGKSKNRTTKNNSAIYIPYLNQEGVLNRLINAVQHLIKLYKKEAEEKKSNDPFAN